MGWHWAGDDWYWDGADGDGAQPWDVTPTMVVLVFAPSNPAHLESVLASCREAGATCFVARDGGARAGVPADKATALLTALDEDRAPLRVSILSGPTAVASDVDRIRMAARPQTSVDVTDWKPV
jgi:hypothetical protein